MHEKNKAVARLRILDQIAEGDEVATRWKLFGTHEGAFQCAPPSGKHVEMTGMPIFRITDGKLIEGWTNEDVLGLLQQLGVVPDMKGR